MGYAFAFVAVFFWSFNVLIAGYLADQLSPIQISFGRWAVACVLLLPFMTKSLRTAMPAIKTHWKLIFSMSMMGVVLMNTFVYQAGHTSTVIDMALLGTTGPIFLVIFSAVFLKKGIGGKQLAGLLVTLSGVVTIITKGHFLNLENFTLVVGDLWMLAMAVTFGIYGVIQAKPIEGISQMALVTVLTLIGTIILTPFFVVSLYTHPIHSLSGEAVVMILYLAVPNSIIAYYCWNTALAEIGALKTGLVYYLMPVLSTLEAHFILHEALSRNQIIGGILVLIGVFIAAYQHPRSEVALKRI